MDRLKLPTVTLCAASSVNVAATSEALRACLAQVDFAESLLFTDAADAVVHRSVRTVPIRRLKSSKDYSAFVLRELSDHIRTEHCLVVQWDGFILDSRQWTDDFLNYDYVGAPWPQFRDGHDVGNGGFSLRSRRLLEACRDRRFSDAHPEDVAICRINRTFLEGSCGICFAHRELATRFAFERAPRMNTTFGFHGIFNMVDVLGTDRFWDIYSSLDDPGTAYVDFWHLMGQLGRSPGASKRQIKLAMDWLGNLANSGVKRFRTRPKT